jgi:DNA-binding transcriptional ArsR family regulator
MSITLKHEGVILLTFIRVCNQNRKHTPNGEKRGLDEDDYYREEITQLLQGNTMSVYALLLTHDELGVREIQRELRFSSPSLSQHHLSKLLEAGLVTKNAHGEYSVSKSVRVGSLTLFVKIGKRLLPRFVFLATLFISMLLAYFFLFISWPLEGQDVMFIALTVIATTIVLYEGRKILLLKP